MDGFCIMRCDGNGFGFRGDVIFQLFGNGFDLDGLHHRPAVTQHIPAVGMEEFAAMEPSHRPKDGNLWDV